MTSTTDIFASLIGRNVNVRDFNDELTHGGKLIAVSDDWLLLAEYDSNRAVCVVCTSDVRAVYLAEESPLRAVSDPTPIKEQQ